MQDLITKYNVPTPRYTAYPPANFFTDQFTASDYLAAVDESNSAENQLISIYIHIPFCKNLCYYCGCNSYPEAPQENIEAYLKALKKEIQMILGRLNSDRRIAQIHYGGGTPNLLPVSKLDELNQWIFSFFKLIDRPEIAIECHPALLTLDYLDGLKQAGFNRFSIGVQDFNPKVLQAINRLPPNLSLSEIVQQARLGSEDIGINLDFIYGLPLQTVESFASTVQEAVSIHPDRVVTFSYAHVPWVNKNQKILESKGLPDVQTKTEMFLEARKILTENGYHPIGIDHYVLRTDELHQALLNGELHRNFQGYCTRRTTGQVYAFGVSAISQLDHCYAQNSKSITEYIQCISESRAATIKGYRLTAEESAIRTLLTELMCNEKIVWSEVAEATGVSTSHLKNLVQCGNEQLTDFINDGIITYNFDGIQITELGRLFTRNVAAALDPLLGQSKKQFSKTL